MSYVQSIPPHDIEAHLAEHDNKSILRFITCGSVDDGKSTLIGRLLYDAKLVFEDQLANLGRVGSPGAANGKEIDLALLLDGLEAEREQGITIDVAYRYFATSKRKFIVADTPGHEEYTRNMVTGASTADLAIILIDSRQGILQQTRRHSYIASLLGIRHVVLAVNKIDLVDFQQQVYEEIVADYMAFAKELGFASIRPIPISARDGDNVISASANTPLVQRGGAARISGNGRTRSDGPGKAFPLPGSDGHAAERGFSRLCRADLLREDFRGRSGRRREDWAADIGQGDCDL